MKEEEKLRSRLIKVLENNLGKENVEDIHSPAEYGIDIVFNMNDAFEQKRKYGIQVKTGPIAATDAQKVLGQLCVAFGHKFSLKPEEFLDAVYVVTDGEVIQPAVNYINSANVGFRNVFWISGNKLSPFLEKFERMMDYQKE